jgi:hypothetical protein
MKRRAAILWLAAVLGSRHMVVSATAKPFEVRDAEWLRRKQAEPGEPPAVDDRLQKPRRRRKSRRKR